jgi:hypothetical protein
MHQQAIMAAHALVGLLPPQTVWAFTVTEADSWAEPPVFNIFVPVGANMRGLAETLKLGKIIDEGETFLSYRSGALLVSIIEQEEHNG